MTRADEPTSAATHAVHVHTLRTASVSDAAMASAEALLSTGERARADRFHFAHDRRQHVLLSALARRALARAVGGDDALAREIVFSTGERGRPEIAGPAELQGMRFNLSKTAGLVVCAVTEALDIGIDVENLARMIDVCEVAPVVLHARERDELAHMRGDARRLWFLKLWTLKEAYAKARGLGLYLPVEHLAFSFDDDGVVAHFDSIIDDDPRAWSFRHLAPTATHQLAVVVAATTRPLDVTLIDAASLFDLGALRAHAPPARRNGSASPSVPSPSVRSHPFEVTHGNS
jgi:4'-phosphopantetheinyl transferase